MNDHPTLLSYEARQVIDHRVRRAEETRMARAVRRQRRSRVGASTSTRLDI